jgi:putative glutamine amidotransferase
MFNWARRRRVPVLGICRGAQVLNLLMGGRLTAVNGHRAVRHPVEAGGRRFEVNSYHSRGMGPGDLAPGLTTLARADDGSIEAFTLNDAPMAGLLWHPEREEAAGDFDRQILDRLFGG